VRKLGGVCVTESLNLPRRLNYDDAPRRSASIVPLRAAGLADGKANILLQIGLKRNPRLADVPFVMDYARREEDQQILRLVFGWMDLERPLAAPPGTPAERVRALRLGFDEAMRDPDGRRRDHELHR
jgi:hypothetical protein